MGKIKFNRPGDVLENLRLTLTKLPTAGVVGESKDGHLRICITANRQFRTVEIEDELANSGNAEAIRRAIGEALVMALEGVEATRESEFKGRLQHPEHFPWSTIKEILP